MEIINNEYRWFDLYIIFDLFILLLIGMGPKIALMPVLELTAELDADTQKLDGLAELGVVDMLAYKKV